MPKLKQHPPENCPITALLVSLPIGSGGSGRGSRSFVVYSKHLQTGSRALTNARSGSWGGQLVSARRPSRHLAESQCGGERWNLEEIV
eukprot:superscaffoldBa00000057_g941